MINRYCTITKITALLFFLNVRCNQGSHEIAESSVYDIINDFYARTDPPYYTGKFLLSKEIIPDPVFDYDALGTEIGDTFPLKREDFEWFWIYERTKGIIQGFSFGSGQNKKMKIINYGEVASCVDRHRMVDWPKLSKKMEVTKFSTISIPYLSKDRCFALFQVCEYSSTYYEEGGQILIFEKSSGKWAFHDQLTYWESANWIP